MAHLLVINGDKREVAAVTIADLLAELGLPAPAMLVELNGLALHRREWSAPTLRAGDRLEFIRVVAGG